MEFCLLYGEVGEAYDAYFKKKDDLGSELADIAIYLLGISELLGFSLEDEITKKIKINAERQYAIINGVLSDVQTCNYDDSSIRELLCIHLRLLNRKEYQLLPAP